MKAGDLGFGVTMMLAVCVMGCRETGAPAPTCAATATPDLTVDGPFAVDTGVAPSTVGASYGQTSCPDQFLVEANLAQPGFAGRDLFVSGRWSLSLPASPCDQRVTLNVTAFDGSAWQPWDVILYAAEMQGTICHAQVQSHTNTASASLGGASVPAARNFQKVRLAIRATRGSTTSKLPVNLIGEAQ